jgi:hypothetical protein
LVQHGHGTVRHKHQYAAEFDIANASHFLENNATHHAGLVASRIIGAPLKLDIMQNGLATQGGIQNCLRELGCNEDEIAELMGVMLQKGSHVSVKGFQRLWRDYGYVK